MILFLSLHLAAFSRSFHPHLSLPFVHLLNRVAERGARHFVHMLAEEFAEEVDALCSLIGGGGRSGFAYFA